LAECTTKDASSAADIVWLKDNVTLQLEVGSEAKMNTQKDSVTGLWNTFSKLQYSATKADVNSKFTCAVKHKSLASYLVSDPMTFVIHCKSPSSPLFRC
ncbi:activated leukocyte cell adhesion molecule b isoform X1, partial [Tachysurus ichikawai]